MKPFRYPDNKVHGANMGPIWGRQDPGGSHVGPMNFAIWIYHGINSTGSWLETYNTYHDDVIKRKHFSRYWPFVQGIHRSLVNSPYKGQWRRGLIFLWSALWINCWVNNREGGDLRCHHVHYDVIVMHGSTCMSQLASLHPDIPTLTCHSFHIWKNVDKNRWLKRRNFYKELLKDLFLVVLLSNYVLCWLAHILLLKALQCSLNYFCCVV